MNNGDIDLNVFQIIIILFQNSKPVICLFQNKVGFKIRDFYSGKRVSHEHQFLIIFLASYRKKCTEHLQKAIDILNVIEACVKEYVPSSWNLLVI